MVTFEDAYIERCSKETETMIANESAPFLQQPLSYLRTHKNEFVYIESVLFEQVGVEGISLEVDDVFGTYDVMLGLKLQKKLEKAIKDYLNTHLYGEGAKFDLLFSSDDGLWDLNFALNYVKGFDENITISEGFHLAYQLLDNLVNEIKTP